MFGENAFSAISWAQIAHSLSVLAAAVPTALIIVLVYPLSKYRIAMMVAAVLAFYIGYDLVRGVIEFGLPNSIAVGISHIFDFVKVFLIMVLAVFLLSFVTHTKKFKYEDTSDTGTGAA